jgi:hypothetical protein
MTMPNRDGKQPDPGQLIEDPDDYEERWRSIETLAHTILDEPMTTLETVDTETGAVTTFQLPTSHPVVRAMTDDILKHVSRPRPVRNDAETADGVMAWLDRETE